ncbi:hypothetical protein ACFQL4_26495 [Halosimplex aquaticum]
MRRREYLRSAVGAAGLVGIAGNALSAAGSDDNVSPSTQSTTASSTSTPQTTADGTDTDDGDGFSPLARIDVTNDDPRFKTTEAVMEPSGRYAFASRFDGFYVVDCDDPENPEIVGSYTGITAPDGREMGSFRDLKYNQGRLMLATDGGASSAGSRCSTSPTPPIRSRSRPTRRPTGSTTRTCTASTPT